MSFHDCSTEKQLKVIMVYKLKSQYFISFARIMENIKKEEQGVGFYTSSPRDLILTQTIFREDEKMKSLSEHNIFFLVELVRFGLDSCSTFSVLLYW